MEGYISPFYREICPLYRTNTNTLLVTDSSTPAPLKYQYPYILDISFTWSNFLQPPSLRPELPTLFISLIGRLLATYYPFPACYHLRSQPERARELTLIRSKVRVCSLEHISRFFFGGTPVAKKSAHLALHRRWELSIRICENLLHCINCSPIISFRS